MTLAHLIEFSDEEIAVFYLSITETILWLEGLDLMAVNTDIDPEPLHKLKSKFDNFVDW